jgi:hypothetical protein
MKGTLSFSLPMENEEFKVAQEGSARRAVLDTFDNYLRNKLKYEELSDEQHKIYQEVRDELWKTKQEFDIE